MIGAKDPISSNKRFNLGTSQRALRGFYGRFLGINKASMRQL
jgi:hypothetical protein